MSPPSRAPRLSPDLVCFIGSTLRARVARPRRLRPGDLGRQGYTGEPLGFGPQPGGGGSVAGPARQPDGGGGADKTEAAARAVVAAVEGSGAGRGVQERLGARPDRLRGQDVKAVVGSALRLVAPEAGADRLQVRAGEAGVGG